MQLQTTSPESEFPNEYIGVIFIHIDQHLKKLFKKYKGFPIFWNMVYTLNKFITPVAPLSNKIKNSVFYLQKQVTPLRSSAHVFKIPASICRIFGTIEQCDMLNILITSLSSTA